jgi:hypothetical protein
MSSLQAWPPTVASLGGWITLRVTGSSLPEFNQIKPQTIETYLSLVRSYCVDRDWDTSIFQNDHIRRLLKGAKSLYRSTKRDRPPITLDHLRALTSSPCYTTADANPRAAYLTAFFGFLRAGEFTWDQRQYGDPRIFHCHEHRDPCRRARVAVIDGRSTMGAGSLSSDGVHSSDCGVDAEPHDGNT